MLLAVINEDAERSIGMSEENKALVRRYYDEILNERKLETLAGYWTDEQMIEPVRRGCFSYFTAFPDLHCNVDELIAEGDRVFCRSTMTGTHDGEYKGIPPTGRHVSAESAEVFRIVDGRFAGYWCLANVAGLMRQLTEEPVTVASAGVGS
jgi:predicted ester cyclase